MGLIQKVGVGLAWGRGIPSLTLRSFSWGGAAYFAYKPPA